MHPIARNKVKKPTIPDDVNTPTNDELSSSSSPSLSLSLAKNTRAKSLNRFSHCPTFSDIVSGASRQARREVGRGQNQPDRVPGKESVIPAGAMPLMPLVHPAFGTWPTFYIPLAALIRGPGDMLSLPLG